MRILLSKIIDGMMVIVKGYRWTYELTDIKQRTYIIFVWPPVISCEQL